MADTPAAPQGRENEDRSAPTNVESSMPDANPPTPTREELERWLEREVLVQHYAANDPEATSMLRACLDLLREHHELTEIAMEMRNALTTLRDNGIFYEDFPLKYSREVMVKHLEYLQRVHARYVELESAND